MAETAAGLRALLYQKSDHIVELNKKIERLQKELKEAKVLVKEKDAQLDDLYTEEPCKKCGYGIDGRCFGCLAKKFETERDELKLEALHWKAQAARKDEELALLDARFQEGRRDYEALVKKIQDDSVEVDHGA